MSFDLLVVFNVSKPSAQSLHGPPVSGVQKLVRRESNPYRHFWAMGIFIRLAKLGISVDEDLDG
jgi:hypothetical protein